MCSPMTDFKDPLKREHFVMEILFLRGFLSPFEILYAFPIMFFPILLPFSLQQQENY